MSDSLSVLIVDDNPMNLEIMDELLSDTYKTSLAESGEEALEKMDDVNPAVVLLDVMMPGIDGYETCERMRKLPHHEALKIIMVSAKAQKEDIEKGFSSGADDYITKPFDIDCLLGTIQRTLAAL